MPTPSPRPGLRLYAAFTAAATLVLILAGGYVTTTRSGDAIPTWPLSWGRLLPPSSEAAVWIEQSHRYVAALVGLLVLGLALAVRRLEDRPELRRLAWAALVAVLVQAALGGLRIFFPKEQQTAVAGASIAIVHACFGQLVFVAVSLVAWLLSGSWARLAADPAAAAARKLGVLTCVFALLQLVAGAVTRHTGGALVFHLVGAGLVSLHAVLLASRLALTSLRVPANVLLLLIVTQVVLGLGSLTMRTPVEGPAPAFSWGRLLVVTGHVAVGALVLLTCVILTVSSCRCRAAEGAARPAEAA